MFRFISFVLVTFLLLIPQLSYGAMNQAQLSTLKTEIDADPKVLGYSGEDNQVVADLLNEAGLSNETIDATYGGVTLTPDDILDCYVVSEYSSLNSTQRDRIDYYVDLSAKSCGGLYINKFLPKLRLIITNLFVTPGNVPDTAQALLDLTYRDATRAEALGLPFVTDMDVARARDLP
jgi:hypothetical protein